MEHFLALSTRHTSQWFLFIAHLCRKIPYFYFPQLHVTFSVHNFCSFFLRLFPNTYVLTALSQSSNMRFMRFSASRSQKQASWVWMSRKKMCWRNFVSNIRHKFRVYYLILYEIIWRQWHLLVKLAKVSELHNIWVSAAKAQIVVKYKFQHRKRVLVTKWKFSNKRPTHILRWMSLLHVKHL